MCQDRWSVTVVVYVCVVETLLLYTVFLYYGISVGGGDTEQKTWEGTHQKKKKKHFTSNHLMRHFTLFSRCPQQLRAGRVGAALWCHKKKPNVS